MKACSAATAVVTYTMVGLSFLVGYHPVQAQDDFREARNKILNKITNTESLHGSWVTVGVAERDGPWLFKLSVDSSRADQQTKELRRIIADTVGSAKYVISREIAKRDVSGSVQALQDAISEDEVFQGVNLKGAYYAPLSESNPAPRLILSGRSPYEIEKQKPLQQLLLLKYNEVLKNYPAVSEGDDGRVDLNIVNSSTLTNGIRFVNNSTREGERLYTLGMDKYKEGLYGEAAKLFGTACVEAPHFDEAKVWLALSQMQMGNERSALKRLKYLVKQERDVGYSSSFKVATALESLQGPIRARFDDLVRKAFNE